MELDISAAKKELGIKKTNGNYYWRYATCVRLACSFKSSYHISCKKYGGTYEGHQNSIELCSMMKEDLTEIRKREFFFKSYFYCIVKTN